MSTIYIYTGTIQEVTGLTFQEIIDHPSADNFSQSISPEKTYYYNRRFIKHEEWLAGLAQIITPADLSSNDLTEGATIIEGKWNPLFYRELDSPSQIAAFIYNGKLYVVSLDSYPKPATPPLLFIEG